MPENNSCTQIRIDTNVLIRYLIGDDQVNAERAKGIFEMAEREELEILVCDTVFLETLFVLQRHYQIEKTRIVDSLNAVLDFVAVRTDTDKAVLRLALKYFNEVETPWPDCLIAAKSVIEQTPVVSFDAHFKKFPEVKLYSFK